MCFAVEGFQRFCLLFCTKGKKRSFVADWYDSENSSAPGRGRFRFLSLEASLGIDPIKAD